MGGGINLGACLCGAIALAGCGSKLVPQSDPVLDGTGGAPIAMTGTGGSGGSAAAGNAGMAGEATQALDSGKADASDGGSACDDTRRSQAPGPALVDPKTPGAGACSGKTLGDVVQAVHAAHVDLADITTLYDKANPTLDGSFIYAFAKSDGGFDLVFKRGGGDCPSGCTENEYWYFETGAGCTATQVGHLEIPGVECVPSDQQAMWGRPPVIPQEYYCSPMPPPDMSGTYALSACGRREPCALAGGQGGEAQPLTTTVTMVVAQTPNDRQIGTVVLTGSNVPELDSTPIPAKFTGRSFTANLEVSNLPAKCPSQRTVSLSYDFDRYGDSVVRVYLIETPDCAQAPENYCKGYLELLLGPPVTR